MYTKFDEQSSIAKSYMIDLITITSGTVFVELNSSGDLYYILINLERIYVTPPSKLTTWSSANDYISGITSKLTWGLGVVANPQYISKLLAYIK